MGTKWIYLVNVSLLLAAVAHSSSIPCAWQQPRAGTVRSALWIDGGSYYTNQWSGTGWDPYGSNFTSPPSGQIQLFNYSIPFDGNTTGPIDIGSLLISRPLTGGGSYDAPAYEDGAMFTSDYELYTYGGAGISSHGLDTILRYDVFPEPGQTTFVPGPQTGYSLPNGITNHITNGAAACAPSENLCFYFSGKHAPGYTPLVADSTKEAPNLASTLLTVDMSTPGQAIWQNDTLGSNINARASGALVWVPVSGKGILLAIGGVLDPLDLNALLKQDDNNTALAEDQAFMTAIPVYDVASRTWTLQQTFGGPPPQLAYFCAVVADTKKGSFDIFVYGGGNGVDPGNLTTITQDAVWVLSVPSFTWVMVNPGSSRHARMGHVCSMPLPNQMLVVGGWNFAETNYCIQDGTLFDVFDMNKLQWTRSYNPSTYQDYQQPSVVSSAVAAQSATINPTVASLFSSAYTSPTTTWYPYPVAATSTGTGGTGGNHNNSSSTPIGAIVGGIVGGIVVVLIVVAIWFCRPSKRQERRIRAESRQSEAGTDTTARSNFITRWTQGTPVGLPPPKDIISDTATEVEEGLSPPMETAEVFGDTYFSPVRRSMRYSGSPAHSPIPPRSPRSFQASSVEADGEEVHEVHGDSRNSKVSSELNQANYHFRSHPLYPHSIDGHLSNQGVNGTNGTGSDMSPPSHPSDRFSDRMGATSPGPVPSELSEQGDTELNSTLSDHVATAKAVPITRPEHKRNPSSISSEIPITPPATGGASTRPEMGPSRNSMPISPLLQQQEVQRPTHNRHGSSLSEMVLSPPADKSAPTEDEEDAERTLVNSPTAGFLPKRKPLRSAYDETRRRNQG